jgi:rifampicin phosphotransferase
MNAPLSTSSNPAPAWLTGADARCATASVGGKARALHALTVAGFPVPAFAVVWPEAELAEADALVAFARVLAGPEGRLAVRSSAVDEDGGDHSFAGQLESYLDVPPEEVPTRVAEVRRSGSSERVLAYRAERGLGDMSAPVPAVILQRMVPAEAAGVAFSVDPVSGRRAHATVAAVAGLGEGLVSGERSADTFTVDRHGAVVARDRAPLRGALWARAGHRVGVSRRAAVSAAIARHHHALAGGRSRWPALHLGQQQYRRELLRRDHSAHVFLRALHLRRGLRAVLPPARRAGAETRG